MNNLTLKEKVDNVRNLIVKKLSHNFGISPENATYEQFYKAVSLVLQDFMTDCQSKFLSKMQDQRPKQVHYICMEFLLGKSLKNNLTNLKLEKVFSSALKSLGVNLEAVYAKEPDAALGNGGLGRLAACFLDSLATNAYPSIGYSLRYEYGVFLQKLIDGWQTELPDFWLSGGSIWLTPKPEEAVIVSFDGNVKESWGEDFHNVKLEKTNDVIAVPYDMSITGYNCNGVSKLRLWAAESRGFNMELFNSGNYIRAVEQDAMASVITKVLYPNDNHPEGKSLRLSQQYFLVSATIQDIVKKHLNIYNTLDNLPEKAAIHLNDTHPVLAISELMRLMLDECGYSWERAFELVQKTFAFTNHTIMSEALEMWSEELIKRRLPRIYQIIVEINNRFVYELKRQNCSDETIYKTSIVKNGTIHMANLAVVCSSCVNGVSELHSNILKTKVFNDFYSITPEKFTNVTNGIAHRRWLCQANPQLCSLISNLIGNHFITSPLELKNFEKFKDDASVLAKLKEIKLKNKTEMAKYVKDSTGITVDPSSMFDVQIKRFHEYKRQLMNALEILETYIDLKENKISLAQFVPRTYIFAGKAASSYYFAKQIIKFIYYLGETINNDKSIEDKMKVVFLENYSVSLAEKLIPASDISEQISLAGTEASGTSNMKFMLNGALTLGTLDGSNVEIFDSVGNENIFIFGMNAEEVFNLRKNSYNPMAYYNNSCAKKAIDQLALGVGAVRFEDISQYLITRDPYMVLADFSDYKNERQKAISLYDSWEIWNKMSVVNIANAGIFSADISIKNYAENIWHIKPLNEKSKS